MNAKEFLRGNSILNGVSGLSLRFGKLLITILEEMVNDQASLSRSQQKQVHQIIHQLILFGKGHENPEMDVFMSVVHLATYINTCRAD